MPSLPVKNSIQEGQQETSSSSGHGGPSVKSSLNPGTCIVAGAQAFKKARRKNKEAEGGRRKGRFKP